MTQIIKTSDFDKIKSNFIKLLPEETFQKEVGFAVQAIAANAKLQECTHESVLKALYNVSLTNLSLNPLKKLAYLTPRWNNAKKVNECLLMPSYVGLSELATSTGAIDKIEARIVYEGDDFDVEYEPDNKIIHRPKFKSKEMIGAYAVATMSNGTKQFEVMTKEELFTVRATSDSWKAFEAGKASSAIWKDWEPEMCRKTVIKRLTKYLPKSGKTEQLHEAIKLDNVDYMASDSQLFMIERLISTSTFDEERRSNLEYMMGSGSLTQEQASNIINDLEQHQQDLLRDRGISTPKAIDRELDRQLKLEGEQP